MSHPRIAFAKIGWCEYYAGEPPRGRQHWLRRFADGHERHNFLQGPDGRFYGYLPPIGASESPPSPKRRDNWLVVFVAPLEGSGKLVPVGWYQKASFLSDWTPRPEYKAGIPFPLDAKRREYCCAIGAARAVLIPATERSRIVVPGRPHFGRTPVLYARAEWLSDRWRATYAKLAERIVAAFSGSRPAETLSTRGGFIDARVAKKVGDAAAERVTQYLEKKGYRVTDRQNDNCGYDLLAVKSKSEIHVEVKGTTGSRGHFYMTPNEYAYRVDPRWRLAMVTQVLSAAQVELLSLADVMKRFDLRTVLWEGCQVGDTT